MQITRSYYLDVLVLFLASLVVFTAGLSSQEIIGFDSRFYLFAEEMMRYGISWFPLTYHQPYPDYPSTSTLLIYLSSLLFGGLNKLVAVLPAAIMAAMTVVITFRIGSLHSRHWGYCAAMLMLLTNAFLKDARAISLDMYPTMITALCFYLIYSADRENKPQRSSWIYPLLLLGFAFRGPIGLVIPAGVICTYYLINGNLKKFFLNGLIAFLLLSICTAILLILAYHIGGNVFMHDVLRMEIIGRMDDAYLPRYFYLTNSLGNYALTYPFALLVSGGVIYTVFTKNTILPDKKFLLQLLGWMMVILLGMSIPDGKKIRYLLPMVPAMALLAAYPFVAPDSQRYFIRLRWLITGIIFLLPLLCLLLVFSIQFSTWTGFAKLNILPAMIFFAVMLISNFVAMVFIHQRTKREKFLMSMAVLCFVIANIVILEPVQLFIDRGRDFVLSTEAQRLQKNASLVFYRESRDGLPIKYLLNRSSQDQPVFIQGQKGLTEFNKPAYFVTSESYYNELSQDVAAQFRMIAKASLGHVPVVVFSRI